MTLHDVGRALRERRLAVIASVLVALVLGAVVFLLRPTTYTATLTVYAAPRADAAATPDAAYQGSLLAKERIPSYVQLVTSPQVLAQVIARGQLPTDVSDLTDRVTATNTTDSVLVDVAVSAPSAAEAVRTANAFADVLPPAVAQIEQSGAPTPPAVTLNAIRPVPVPTKPSSPGLVLTLGVALLAGIVVGLAVALVRDALDRTVRTPEDLSEALGGGALGGGALGTGSPVLAAIPPTTTAGPALEAARSPGAEGYRQLRTALHSGRHATPGVLAVTSPGPREGRTTVTCNLAAAAAAAGLGVVVVDADLRRPMVATTLGIAPGSGLTDVLAGRLDVDGALRGASVGFDVLPTGSLPANPSELLAGGGLDEVFTALYHRYDLVLVDSPPTLPVTDAAVVAEAADGVVVLARARITSRPALSRAVDTLTAAGAAVVGTVLVGSAGGPTLLVDPEVRSTIAPRPMRPVERPSERSGAFARASVAPATEHVEVRPEPRREAPAPAVSTPAVSTPAASSPAAAPAAAPVRPAAAFSAPAASAPTASAPAALTPTAFTPTEGARARGGNGTSPGRGAPPARLPEPRRTDSGPTDTRGADTRGADPRDRSRSAAGPTGRPEGGASRTGSPDPVRPAVPARTPEPPRATPAGSALSGLSGSYPGHTAGTAGSSGPARSSSRHGRDNGGANGEGYVLGASGLTGSRFGAAAGDDAGSSRANGRRAADPLATTGRNGTGTHGSGTNGTGTNGSGTNGTGSHGSGTNGSGTNGTAGRSPGSGARHGRPDPEPSYRGR